MKISNTYVSELNTNISDLNTYFSDLNAYVSAENTYINKHVNRTRHKKSVFLKTSVPRRPT